jgi:ADP-ribose pyrophosphatase YjhB (NUDIX family)
MDKTFIDKLAWIYLKDGKLLSTKSFGKDVYYIPGGKREAGESDTEALLRELKEELSVDLILETIKHLKTFEAQAHGKPEGTLVRMTCYTADYSGVLTPSAEVEELVWLSYADRETSSPVDKIIFDYLHEKGLLS